MYYAAIFLNIAYQGLAPRPEAPNGLTLLDVVSGFTFLSGFKPGTINSIAIGGWSVAVETTFYFLLPVIFPVVTSLRRAIGLFVVSGLAFTLISRQLNGYFSGGLWSEYWNFLWFPIEFPVFCLGVVAYQAWKKYAGRLAAAAPRQKKAIAALLLAAAGIVMAISLPITNSRLYWSSSSLVLLVLGLGSHDWRLFVNPVTVFFGRISYSIYLTHFFVLIVLQRWMRSSNGVFGIDPRGHMGGLVVILLLATAGSTLVSYITFRLIDQPGIALGKRLVARGECRRKPEIPLAGAPTVPARG